MKNLFLAALVGAFSYVFAGVDVEAVLGLDPAGVDIVLVVVLAVLLLALLAWGIWAMWYIRTDYPIHRRLENIRR